MSTESHKPSVDVPPPPLAAEEEPTPSRLHWATAVFTMVGVGGVQWAFTWVALLVMQPSAGLHVSMAQQPMGLARPASIAFAAGLAAVLSDRVALPHWPRSLRWSLAMGGATLVVSSAWTAPSLVVLLPNPGPLVYNMLLSLGLAAVGNAWYGACLGLASRVEVGLTWRLPLVGIAAGLAYNIVFNALRFGLSGGVAGIDPETWRLIGLSAVFAAASGAGMAAAFAAGLVLGRRERDSG